MEGDGRERRLEEWLPAMETLCSGCAISRCCNAEAEDAAQETFLPGLALHGPATRAVEKRRG